VADARQWTQERLQLRVVSQATRRSVERSAAAWGEWSVFADGFGFMCISTVAFESAGPPVAGRLTEWRIFPVQAGRRADGATSFPQQLRGFRGKIGQDHVRTGALDRREGLHHYPLAVQPS